MTERWREPVSTLPTEGLVKAKEKEGWHLVAVEWSRSSNRAPEDSPLRPIPYGLRISSDCSHLEVDPVEREVISLIVAMIAGDHPLSKIAEELNERGFQTRQASPWTQVSIFKLLPRVVEFGPEVLSADEWSDNKRKLLEAVS